MELLQWPNPDEFDDLSDSKFNAALITPSIDVSKVEANSLILKFDSSWRKTGGSWFTDRSI